jgi:hypothetical protein
MRWPSWYFLLLLFCLCLWLLFIVIFVLSFSNSGDEKAEAVMKKEKSAAECWYRLCVELGEPVVSCFIQFCALYFKLVLCGVAAFMWLGKQTGPFCICNLSTWQLYCCLTQLASSLNERTSYCL